MAREGLRLGDQAADAPAKMATIFESTIFESLERLQTGILKAEAVLGWIRADLQDFRQSLDPPGDEATRA